MLTAGLVIDIGREHGELGPLALLLQHAEGVVEFMVTHCHGIVANVVHRHEVRLGVLQIGLRHAGIHITTGKNQHVTASSLGIGTQLLDQSLLGSHTVLIFSVVPETAVGIVGVQDGQFADIFGAGATVSLLEVLQPVSAASTASATPPLIKLLFISISP